jgi:hypothetical protein
MTLPTSVEPYVEPESSVPYVIPLIVSLLAVGLWLDLSFWQYAIAPGDYHAVSARCIDRDAAFASRGTASMDPSPRADVFRFDHRRVVRWSAAARSRRRDSTLGRRGRDGDCHRCRQRSIARAE